MLAKAVIVIVFMASAVRLHGFQDSTNLQVIGLVGFTVF
jgi:hypothetical protein